MKTISGALKAHLAEDVTTVCTLWRIERLDGVVMGFTDHDQDILFDGLNYSAESGYMRSALTNDASLTVDTVELNGFLDHDGIEFYDLRNGVYDYAKVQVSLVNWSNLAQGRLIMRTGQFGEHTITDAGDFRIELNGLTRHLAQKIGQQFTPECRASLGDERCKIETSPALRVGRRRYEVGQRMRVPVGDRSAIVLELQNPSFEEPLENVGNVVPMPGNSATNPLVGYVPGWESVGQRAQGTAEIANGIYGPTDGIAYVAPVRGMSQKLNLATDPDIDLAVLDAGFYDAIVEYDVIGLFAGGGAGVVDVPSNLNNTEAVRLTFIDATNNELSSGATRHFVDEQRSPSPPRIWKRRSFRVQVPALMRYLRISQELVAPVGYRVMGFDNYEVRFVDRRYGEGTYDQYNNLEWRCVQAGQTANLIPAFPTVPGAAVTDGSVVWQAETAKYAHTAAIVTVESRKVFTVSGLGLPDGFYANGSAIFESGPNKGRAIEVKSWTAGTQRVELFLSMIFQPEIGDIVRLTAGCDGKRETCVQRFANILNFRGEPDVPGSDKYLDVGNPKG